ncbi:hypothetical protein FH972_024454 [Carpinus fangiana]|uniref:Putative rRNA methyltransferase n=1 Tax=Carpinus fangiana TaxID=176857 RepID=A0A5N6KY30_9ROSI|nr:hypothetical protein FH972_024454 [Carpinus fangiana]
MVFQKKTGKGRLDKYYKLAKEKGYRSRAAFKIIQLNKKYHVLEKSKVLLDLCAAPGGWCQVAAEVMPVNSLIVGVDLAPIKPIPRVITFQSDITTDKCRSTIRQHLKTWKADTVLHDGAPNVGTAWVQDSFNQAELVLESLRLATDFLAPGGSFITKIFRSKDYNSLLWVFNQLFGKVEATKPPSSRNVSAEIFVVCLNYKAPKHIDPRFLDPKTVFAELPTPTPNNEAKVFNPEKKKRKREGYEEGEYLQFKEAPISDFIQTTDPIAMLGSLNKLSFEHKTNGDLALATLDRLPETTEEIRICCNDLRVLGRKEFKMLLRYRLKVRDMFGFSKKRETTEKEAGEEVTAIEDMDDEMKEQEEMQNLKDLSDKRKKKEKRRENERKNKEIVRMQMNMTTPNEIGLEQHGLHGEDAVFNLKPVDRAGAASKIASGKMHSIQKKEEDEEDEPDSDAESDDAGDDLEGLLDEMYDEYRENRADRDAKYRAKKARKEHDDFEGFSDRDENESSEEEDIVQDEESDTSDEEDEETQGKPIFHDPTMQGQAPNGLSKRAAFFFDQDMFKGIDLPEENDNDSGIELEDSSDEPVPATATNKKIAKKQSAQAVAQSGEESEEDGFEVVKTAAEQEDWSEEPNSNSVASNQRKPDIDIITAEAMTLAHQLASGQITRAQLQDDNFNKYTLRDVDGLPEWFLDDENQHSKLQRPTTKAAADAIKEKLRALNARPIKKVREAKMRKKFKAAQRLEKLKKKSALLIEDGDMTEKDKAQAIQGLMAKAAKKKPRQQVSVVVARGGNRGISGRPKGTKGKYKMVDSRMKKDTRGLKRAAKRNKK